MATGDTAEQHQSFFTLNGFLFYFYRSIALRVWLWLFFVSGFMLWGLAVDGNHIGASGIIYGLAVPVHQRGHSKQPAVVEGQLGRGLSVRWHRLVDAPH